MTGKDITIILSQNGTALASTRIRSNEVQTLADAIEKASATEQEWKEFVAGRKEWSVTVGYLVMATSQVSDLLYAGQMFDITIKSGSTNCLTGRALMTAVKQTATIGNLAQGSFSLKGSGALSVPVST